jgi:amino acid transporter
MGEEQLGLKRALKTGDLAVYGMCFMIPVAPFAWYGTLVEGAMGMVALGYAIALVAMLFTGFSYASMANRYPMGGSVYRYVQQTTTPSLGFLAGWGMLLSYFFLPAVCYCVGATFVAALTPSIPAWVWYVIFTVVTGVIALAGIEGSSTTSWILFGIQVAAIILFIVIVFVQISRGNLSINFNGFKNPYEPFNLHGVLGATQVVVLSYVGFDAISTLADETVKPEKMIGKAVLLSIILMGILFSVMAWLCAVCVPDYRTLTMDESAVLQIFQAIGGSKLEIFECAVIVVAFGLACGLECLIASTRVIYSMASD